MTTAKEFDRIAGDFERRAKDSEGQTAQLAVVYEAEWQWGEIVLDRREIVFADGFEAEACCEYCRDAVLEAAGLDPTDAEAGISVVEEVAAHHTAIRPGDFAANSGYGSDWIFVRVTN